MAAPSPSDIISDPKPLNPAFAHPLPVLQFPGLDLVNSGDMNGLPGDTGKYDAADSFEPSQH